jgi:phage gpG-like protein
MPSVNVDSYLLDNLKIDIEMSPDLQNLINNNQEIAPEAIKLGLRKITRQGSKNTKQKVRSLGLVRTGTLAKSITGRTNKSKSFIGTKLWYAHFLEGGTVPHMIKARKGKSLFFPGARGFIKQVHHPGIKAYKFTESTVEDMQRSGEIDSLFAQGVQEAIEELSSNG